MPSDARPASGHAPDPRPPNGSAGANAQPDAVDLDALAEALADRLGERLAAAATQRYLTVAHAAAYADLSEDSIRSLLASEKLTPLRPVAGRVLIDRRELDALVRTSTGKPRRGRGIRAKKKTG